MIRGFFQLPDDAGEKFQRYRPFIKRFFCCHDVIYYLSLAYFATVPMLKFAFWLSTTVIDSPIVMIIALLGFGVLSAVVNVASKVLLLLVLARWLPDWAKAMQT